jgi:hypothetical protein
MSSAVGISGAVEVFKGFFSRGFWFGSFLPVLIIAGIHVVLAAWAGLIDVSLADLVKAELDKLIAIPLVTFVLVILAYAATPIIPLVRGFLDGSLLPQRVHDRLWRDHMIAARKTRSEVDDATQCLSDAGDLNARETALLQQARAEGNKNGADPVQQTAQDALDKIIPLVDAADKGEMPSSAELGKQCKALSDTLKLWKTDLDENHRHHGAAVLLTSAQAKLTALLKDAETHAEHHMDAVLSRSSRIAYDNPQATRMADIRLLIEKYSQDTYGVDFDFLWPRLQALLPGQSEKDTGTMSDKLGMASAQIDFSVLSLGLSLTVFLWLPYFVWTGDPVKFFAIAAIAPLLTVFLYFVTLESQIAFGAVMRAAIDTYRLKLLDELCQPRPATLADERELWWQLQLTDKLRQLNPVYNYSNRKA